MKEKQPERTAIVLEIDPTRRYLLVFKGTRLSLAEEHYVREALNRWLAGDEPVLCLSLSEGMDVELLKVPEEDHANL